MPWLKQYGVETTIYFPLINGGETDFENTPVSFASGDSQISKDGGAFVNTTNAPAHEGNGIYSLTITATEMQAADIAITIIDPSTGKEWEDQAIFVQTYGNASASMAFDLNTATQSVNVTQISGDATAADNCELFFDDTGFNASNSTIGTVTTNTDMRGTDNALLSASCTAPDNASIAAILVDTGTTIPATLSTLATASALTTVDTVVDAIKVKTDSLTFDVAGTVNSNVTYVNDILVGGAGTSGDPWGPA